MSQRLSTTIILLTATLLTGTAWSFGSTIAVGMNTAADVPPPTTPFKADAVLETAEHTINTTIYYRPGYTRDEMTIGNQETVVLQDLNAGKFYMLMPQGMYMEYDSGTTSEQIQEFQLVERSVVGKEKVNGFDTTKYKVIYEGPDGRYGGFSWFTDDNITVRAFMISETNGEKQRVKFDITNLERGAQPMARFEIPANYRKFDMGGAMNMGAMMQGAMGQTQGQPPRQPARTTQYAQPAPGGDGMLQMVQQNLAALGYATGNTDGIPSTETTIAISQFQAERDMPVTGEPSPQLAGIIAAEAASKQGSSGSVRTATAVNSYSDEQSLRAARQACLREKIEAAQAAEKKKRGFGRLLRAATRVVSGGAAEDLMEKTNDLYEANATADDLAAAAKDLGLTQSDVEACQNPG